VDARAAGGKFRDLEALAQYGGATRVRAAVEWRRAGLAGVVCPRRGGLELAEQTDAPRHGTGGLKQAATWRGCGLLFAYCGFVYVTL